MDNQVELLILQHPTELGHPKGTAGLLALSLARCTVRVGEVFDPAEMAPGWLQDAALLYPGSREASMGEPPEASRARTPARLVLLDGTWRKSHRMLCLNPWLAALPRYALAPTRPSRYRIRRAPRPDQLSTLEAACLALSELEGRPAAYEPLMAAMAGHVQAIAARMGLAPDSASEVDHQPRAASA